MSQLTVLQFCSSPVCKYTLFKRRTIHKLVTVLAKHKQNCKLQTRQLYNFERLSGHKTGVDPLVSAEIMAVPVSVNYSNDF